MWPLSCVSLVVWRNTYIPIRNSIESWQRCSLINFCRVLIIFINLAMRTSIWNLRIYSLIKTWNLNSQILELQRPKIWVSSSLEHHNTRHRKFTQARGSTHDWLIFLQWEWLCFRWWSKCFLSKTLTRGVRVMSKSERRDGMIFGRPLPQTSQNHVWRHCPSNYSRNWWMLSHLTGPPFLQY